jgi:hypothetical protein
MLKTDPQHRSKIVERDRVIRMGWKLVVEGLSEKRNCFVDINLLVFFFKLAPEVPGGLGIRCDPVKS